MVNDNLVYVNTQSLFNEMLVDLKTQSELAVDLEHN